jgi:5-formaminoimidazole-4-carboxamide-1-beta-D-ribofuranosyl 5'-monophosphate synthetase
VDQGALRSSRQNSELNRIFDLACVQGVLDILEAEVQDPVVVAVIGSHREAVDVEKGLEKVKEGVQLVKASRERLKEVENEFEDVKKELEGDDDEPEELSF